MIPAADIIRLLMLDLDLDLDGDWPIFVGYMPDKPDNSICVYDTMGTNDGRIMRTGEHVDHPGIQIRLRGVDYQVARRRMETIDRELAAQNRAIVVYDEESEIVTYEVQNVSRTGTVNSLGAEQSDLRRYHFTLNAITTIKEKE